MISDLEIIDANITLGRWPMRRVPCDELDKLAGTLRAHNVVEAWAGHYDGLFHADLAAVNDRLAGACHSQKELRLVPFGSIDPTAPNWVAELDRCAGAHRMPGVRLHPSYRNYKLDHPTVLACLRAAAERKLIVQIVVIMEDSRMMHPLLRVPAVDLSPLEMLLPQMPELRLVLLNALTSPTHTDQLARLINAGQVYVDMAMLETLAALETIVKDIDVDRILFGSHTPSFYFESALLKLQESNLPSGHRLALTHENARRLLSLV